MNNNKSRIERMLVEIGLGISKEDSLLNPLSSEESETWDKLVLQVAEIKTNGGEIEIPSEIPDID